jgi:hypothetical protein
VPPAASRRVAWAAASVAAAWSCALLNPLDEFERGRPPDGGVAEAGAVDAPPACALKRWPNRPASEPPGGADVTVINAMTLFDVGADVDGGGIPDGYDLDGVCTCPGPHSCARPDAAKPACDGDGGVDNAGGELFVSLARLLGEATSITESIQRGKYGIVMRLRDYNGLADDPFVVLEVFPSAGIDGKVFDAGGRDRPLFDGQDVWTLDPTNAIAASGDVRARFFDDKAYVAGGTLVATLDGIPLRISGVAVVLQGSLLTAKLVRDGATFRVADGRLVGRISTRNLLTALEGVEDPVGGGGVCGDSGFYQGVVPIVCAAVDVSSDPRLDSTGAPCDALSATIRFAGAPAKMGPLYDPGPLPRPCGADWIGTCR